jgi:nucleoside-diphosphate-sugar epimerase
VKRVLVTGGAGFISSTFVRHLLAATPYEVVSLDRSPTPATWRTSPM